MLRYVAIAEKIQLKIEKGLLQTGDRVPSVRALCKNEKCSLSTAQEALHLLEREGWIDAIPQSGHYVSARKNSSGIRHVAEVSIDDKIGKMLLDVSNPRIVPFGTAVPVDALLPLARITRSIIHASRSTASHLYEDPRGDSRLRRLLALRFSRGSELFSEEDVIITNGCTEAIALSLLSTTVRGDTVLIESPSYFGNYQLLERLGLQAVEIPASATEGADPHAFALAAARHRPKAAILIPNYSNPTGSLMPSASRRLIADVAHRENIAIIEDNVYGEVGYDHATLETITSHGASGVLCGSISKTVAPGLRIGWAISCKYRNQIHAMKRVMNLSTNRLSQWAVLDMMQKRSYDSHLKRFRRSLKDLSKIYQEALQNALPDAKIVAPAGGFLLWIETPANTTEFVRRATAAGISLFPGSLFDATGSHNRCFRLNFAVEWNGKTQSAVKKLGEIYSKCKG